MEWLKRQQAFTPQLAQTRADEALLSAFDVEGIQPEALLWQMGYLTFCGQRRLGARIEYQLGYPNLEVKSALNDAFIQPLHGNAWRACEMVCRVYERLVTGDLSGLRHLIESLFIAIPNDG